MTWERIVRRGIAWKDLCTLEDELVARVERDRAQRFLLFSEPRPVYTAGRNADPRGLLVAPGTADVVTAPRGGQWTYHGPGQVVVYPIVALETLGLGHRSVRRYAEQLRAAVVSAAHSAGVVDAQAQDEPSYGVFVRNAKLAAFGLSFRRGIAAHGVATYVTAQTLPFRRIDPCGVAGGEITSFAECGASMGWEAVADELSRAIAHRFHR